MSAKPQAQPCETCRNYRPKSAVGEREKRGWCVAVHAWVGCWWTGCVRWMPKEAGQ